MIIHRGYVNYLILLLISAFIAATPLLAQSESDEFSEQDGIRFLDNNLWIFPANHLGNSLYFEKNKILTRKDIQITDAIEALDGFVYLGLDENNEYQMGFVGSEGADFTEMDGGYFYLTSEDRSKKRYYWLNGENKIENLLPRYNTAAGLVFNGVDKAAFYHISKGETIELEDGTLKYQYTFRIHVADRSTFQVRHLPNIVNDFNFRLKLEWIQPDELKYTLSTGESGTIETW